MLSISIKINLKYKNNFININICATSYNPIKILYEFFNIIE